MDVLLNYYVVVFGDLFDIVRQENASTLTHAIGLNNQSDWWHAEFGWRIFSARFYRLIIGALACN